MGELKAVSEGVEQSNTSMATSALTAVPRLGPDSISGRGEGMESVVLASGFERDF